MCAQSGSSGTRGSGVRESVRDSGSRGGGPQSSAREIIGLYHVDKVYPPNQAALRDIDVRIDRGEFVFITGASGAGKSTLLKLVFAEEQASRGDVLVGGRNLVRINREQRTRLRRNIGVIFQDYKLIETRTVLDNVAFAMEVVGIRERERFQSAFRMLAALGLKDRVQSYPRMLSGGEQQRVSIARALINRPQIILADEPTGNLDPDMTVAVFNLLLEANRSGATIVVASHDLAMIEEVNKRTLVLDKGKMAGDFETPGGINRRE